jgi:hypothetical protein
MSELSLLLAVLALGPVTADAVASQKALVLKEEGQRVAVGAEVGVQLQRDYGCVIEWRGHISRNDASVDKITFEPTNQGCESAELYPSHLEGAMDEVEIPASGNATVDGS